MIDKIIDDSQKLLLLNNNNCLDAELVFMKLSRLVDLTYLTYVYEDFSTNEKFFYTSNWEWQNLMINNKLINNCPVYQSAFNYLNSRKNGNIIIPWNYCQPKNKEQKNVCGLRNEFNISNGIGYCSQGFGTRESIAFAGDVKNQNFHCYFTKNPKIIFLYLSIMRSIFLKNSQQRIIISDTIH